MKRIAFLPLFLLLLAVPRDARGWGEEGHSIVAIIAEKHLTPKARAEIAKLIGEDRTIATSPIPVWADAIKRSANYTKLYPDNDKYHYINIPVGNEKWDFAADPMGTPKNLHEAIVKFKKDLKDQSLDTERRKEALMFLVHFIGDLHQPLHCGDMSDYGGNKRMVSFSFNNGKPDTRNLHLFWDVMLVNAAVDNLSPKDAAQRLLDNLPKEKIEEYQKGELVDWILESQKLARDYAYGKANIKDQDGIAPQSAIKLDDAYLGNAKRVAIMQMTRGGLRLAGTLNAIFKDE